MRIVLFGAVGLAVGIAAGTGVSALKQKKVLEAELQARQDSLAAAQADSLASVAQEGAAEPSHRGSPAPPVASADRAGTDHPPAEEEPQADSPSTSDDPGAGSQDSADVPGRAAPADPEVGPAITGGGTGAYAAPPLSGGIGNSGEDGDGEAEEEGPRRLAKIFGAMDPKEAAAVLENLANAEAQTILRHISERKVAAILSHFEPARAATLSRVVMGLETGEPEEPEGGDGTEEVLKPDTARASGEPGGREAETGTGALNGKAGGGG